MTDSVISTNKIWTDKYKDTIHVFLQRLNAGFVVALRFFPVKRPERISTAVETTYHAGFCVRIIGDRTFTRVVNCCLLPLWWRWGSTYPNQGLPRVVHECRRQAERRRDLVVLGSMKIYEYGMSHWDMRAGEIEAAPMA
jgi:hypothetical protein